MGLFGSVFSGPTKSQIDSRIAHLEREVARCKSNIEICKRDKEPFNASVYKSHMEQYKGEIKALKAQRKSAPKG